MSVPYQESGLQGSLFRGREETLTSLVRKNYDPIIIIIRLRNYVCVCSGSHSSDGVHQFLRDCGHWDHITEEQDLHICPGSLGSWQHWLSL